MPENSPAATRSSRSVVVLAIWTVAWVATLALVGPAIVIRAAVSKKP